MTHEQFSSSPLALQVETLKVGPRASLACWDVGGCDKMRPLWRHYTKVSAPSRPCSHHIPCLLMASLMPLRHSSHVGLKCDKCAGQQL